MKMHSREQINTKVNALLDKISVFSHILKHGPGDPEIYDLINRDPEVRFAMEDVYYLSRQLDNERSLNNNKLF